VPPERAFLAGDVEAVGVGGAAGADGALRHHAGTIGPAGEALEDAMPVDGDVVGGVVDDVYHDGVAVASLHDGPWELPVHRRDYLTLPQPIDRQVAHLHMHCTNPIHGVVSSRQRMHHCQRD
jgi:hypothetical protein